MWEREIYFKHQNIAIMVNIDFSVFAFSSTNGHAIPGKTCMCNVLPVLECHAIVKCFENDIPSMRSLESCRTVLNSKSNAKSSRTGLWHKCC